MPFARQEKIIIYPITGNPPTWGHGDLVLRASALFDHLYWIVGNNIHKKFDFTIEERMDMMSSYLIHYGLENVTIDHFDGAMIRYAESKKAQFFLRGLRNTTDFQYEVELASGNRGIIKEIETICMFARPHYSMISSSLVRELAILGESIDQYVLPCLTKKIVERLSEKT